LYFDSRVWFHAEVIAARSSGRVADDDWGFMVVIAISADPTATDTAKIGQRLKAVRRAQRRTLEEVAEASGLTKGFLSKIERDLASASVAALLRICATLNVPFASLFENDSTGEVVRSGSYPRIDFGGQDLAEYLLTPPAERRVQVILSQVQPGGGSGNEGYSLPAEVEFVYVVSGALDLGFAERTIRLGAGDAFTFDPTTPHTFRSADPDAPTTVMWVLCPALAAADPGDPGCSRAAYAARIAG
jgi:transcriptional regulator with XRE-family HTH domain